MDTKHSEKSSSKSPRQPAKNKPLKPKTNQYYHGIWETQFGLIEVTLDGILHKSKPIEPAYSLAAVNPKTGACHDADMGLIDAVAFLLEPEFIAKDINRFIGSWIKMVREYAFSLPITRDFLIKDPENLVSVTIEDEDLKFLASHGEIYLPTCFIYPILRKRKPHKLKPIYPGLSIQSAFDGQNIYIKQGDTLLSVTKEYLTKVKEKMVDPFENLQERIIWIEETDFLRCWHAATMSK